MQAGPRTSAEGRRVRYDDPKAPGLLAEAFCEVLGSQFHAGEHDLIFLCIGTDRSTGDSLGPLVGLQLDRACPPGSVYGTLERPVHASNLAETLDRVRHERPQAFLVAVDACLGRLENVGVVAVGSGPLLPGAGVNKSLPQVGRAYITGTVNVGGFMEYFVLQNTRLSLVVRMADVIAAGVIQATQALLWGGLSSGARQAAPARLPVS